MLLVAVSVTKIQWYDEDKCFATAFSDGVVSLCTKDSYIAPIVIDAHQVNISECQGWFDGWPNCNALDLIWV